MNYRNLTQQEIDRMQRNGCSAADWERVKVKEGFNCENYRRVDFYGDIFLGLTDKTLYCGGDVMKQSGIYDAAIYDCTIGDNVYIGRIGEYINRYTIADNCYIANVGKISTSGLSSFGNGTDVEVLNENGGRTVKIYDRLTAQIAYMLTFYRHEAEFISRLTGMIDDYANQNSSSTGFIGENVVITNTTSIINVRFESLSSCEGASFIANGTVGQEAKIGHNVIAEDFILSSQGVIDSGAIVKKTFIGQASVIADGFTAHESLIFANSILKNGEAAAIFAGPHTVSMHRSTLLIGGYFSFFNAGSGTNESNHLYKIGPVHQGVMERGCHTGSNAYIVWPARIGRFSLLAGSHYRHPDTAMLPYSYVMGDDKGNTTVIPAANLTTAGLIRDILKWRTRDHRKECYSKLDLINYNTLSPLSANAMYSAINFLNEYEKDADICDKYNFRLKHDRLRQGREFYALGCDFFMGETVVKKLLTTELDTNRSLGEQLSENLPDEDVTTWIDLSGLLAPQSVINKIIDDVKEGKVATLGQLSYALVAVANRYPQLCWKYVVDHFRLFFSHDIETATAATLEAIIQRWIESVTHLDIRRKKDAMKDFSETVMISYGIDGDDDCRRADFDAVRGTLDDCNQILAIRRHYARVAEDGYKSIALLENFKEK